MFDEKLAATIEKSVGRIKDKKQKLNFLLILYGLSLTNNREDVFNYCIRKLDQNMGEYPRNFAEARVRIDAVIRTLLEILLIAAIITCNVKQCQRTLVYGRKNTFIIGIPEYFLQVALRLTEQDGPGNGDMSLLRVLVQHKTIVKRKVETSTKYKTNEI